MEINNLVTLLQLSESDKRFFLALFLVVILVFVIIAYLGKLIVWVTKHQGKKLDKLVAPVLKMKVITDPKDFKKYTAKKNWIILYKESRIPVLIILIALLILFVTDLITHNFSHNPFYEIDSEGTIKGFASIMFFLKWDIKVADGTLQIPKIQCTHTPDFRPENIPDYLFVLSLFTGVLWYLFRVQSFIGRALRSRALTESVFKNSLDNYNQLDDIAQNGIPKSLAQEQLKQSNEDRQN